MFNLSIQLCLLSLHLSALVFFGHHVIADIPIGGGGTDIGCPKQYPTGNDTCTVCQLSLDEKKCDTAQKLVNAIKALDDGCSKGAQSQATKKACNNAAKDAAFTMADAFKLFNTSKICKHACDDSSEPTESDDKLNQPSGKQFDAGPECAAQMAKCKGILRPAKLEAEGYIKLGKKNLEMACEVIDQMVKAKCNELKELAGPGMSDGLDKFDPDTICANECALLKKRSTNQLKEGTVQK